MNNDMLNEVSGFSVFFSLPFFQPCNGLMALKERKAWPLIFTFSLKES